VKGVRSLVSPPGALVLETNNPAASGRALQLSVIVVSWNTRELLAHCLDSVFRQVVYEAGVPVLPAVGGMEVVVVDNASADGSARMVQERFPQVKLLANAENVGFARANNQALPLCRGRYVLLLNPDTQVLPDGLASLVCFMDQHPRAGAAGARLLNADGTVYHSCQPAPTLRREFWRLFHLDTIWPYARYPMERWTEEPRMVDVVQGACMMLRRTALDQVGTLDEDYFIYSEEVDLCFRLRRHRWQVWWVPQASVVHVGGQSTRQVAAAMFLRLYQGKVLYFRKNHGRRAAQLYKLVLAAAAVARLLLSPLAWVMGDPQREELLALAGHYRRLLLTLSRF
jgi:N-acetylglucosaminyl-diphospho-decaprenol L-rhamnosyltransferase